MRLTAAVGLAAMLQACAMTDPLLNENDWHPTGANEMNIAAQVARPADLVHGRAATGGADGELASAAVARLRAGKVKKLPDSGLATVQIQSTPGGP